MILAAGKGTRLLPLTELVPKPMILINSEPLIVHQIRWLKRAGIREIVINLHHLGEQIESCLGSGRHLGVQLKFSREPELLDTGGGIAKALPLLGESTFLVLNGDVWTNFPFTALAKKTTEFAHLILEPATGASNSKDFRLDGNFATRDYDKSMHTHTFCGISLLHPRLFNDCLEGAFSLTRDLLFGLSREHKVTGESFEGTWIDIGTPDGLKHARRVTM